MTRTPLSRSKGHTSRSQGRGIVWRPITGRAQLVSIIINYRNALNKVHTFVNDPDISVRIHNPWAAGRSSLTCSNVRQQQQHPSSLTLFFCGAICRIASKRVRKPDRTQRQGSGICFESVSIVYQFFFGPKKLSPEAVNNFLCLQINKPAILTRTEPTRTRIMTRTVTPIRTQGL